MKLTPNLTKRLADRAKGNIKTQRANAREAMKADPMLTRLVLTITETGSDQASVVVPIVEGRLGYYPTKHQWKQAKELSESFKVVPNKGRRGKDWENDQVGTLIVGQATGYTSAGSALASPLWNCQCHQTKCGLKYVLTAHLLASKLTNHKLHGCDTLCPLQIEWVNAGRPVTKRAQRVQLITQDKIDQMVDAIPDDNHTPLGTNSTKLH